MQCARSEINQEPLRIRPDCFLTVTELSPSLSLSLYSIPYSIPYSVLYSASSQFFSILLSLAPMVSRKDCDDDVPTMMLLQTHHVEAKKESKSELGMAYAACLKKRLQPVAVS